MDLDWDSIKTLADVGLGTVALMMYHRQGEVLKNHEIRITTLERVPRVPRVKRKKC